MASRKRTPKRTEAAPFNVVVVAQDGRLQYEAALFCASFRAAMPDCPGRLLDGRAAARAEMGPRSPHLGRGRARAAGGARGRDPALRDATISASLPLWQQDRAAAGPARGRALRLLRQRHADHRRPGRGALRFRPPFGLARREGTWPRIELYGPGYTAIWKSLYDRFGLDFESSLDLDATRRILAALPLFQRRLLLLPLPAGIRRTLFLDYRAGDPRRPVRPSSCASRSIPGSTRWRCRW
jgi:hypothetical protein